MDTRTNESGEEVVPVKLPDNPVGWKKTMTMHMSMSDKKSGRYGVGVYEILDADGNKTPIGYSYNSHPTSGHQGFSCRGSEEIFKTWKELVAAWPRLVVALPSPPSKG